MSERRQIDRLTKRRFRRDESGSIAVEGAMVASFLAAAVVGLIDIKNEFNEHHKLSDSLRTTAAYVSAGGTDLDKLSALFEGNYGVAPDSFSTALVCAPPPQMLDDGSVDDENVDNYNKVADNLSSASQKEPGTWDSCPSDAFLRFVELAAQHKTKSVFSGRDINVKSRIRLRVYEDTT